MNYISSAIEELQNIYSRLNHDYYNGDLPDVMITIQASPRNKYYGWFWNNKWDNNVDFLSLDKNKNPLESYSEINISAEWLSRDIYSIVSTLQHEMIHCYCSLNDIQDTSNHHVYHNKRFKSEAEKRGLIIKKAKTIGWSVTTPSKEFKEYIDSLKINTALFKFSRKPFVQDKLSASSTSKYQCPKCKTSVRGKHGLHIMCDDCKMEMDET